LANAHREIASILNTRGVYIEGLNHAKEATVLSPDVAFGYDEMAVALIGLQRFSEAASAESQAIRLSDGKYGWMHFNLGSAYFKQENWSFASQSYEKAAELSPQEPAAAFNVALCNQRLGHFVEAAHWYEEYLHRKPDADDRTEILERIRALKR
jgi:tetratricopeptide (TPR) repeat protein